MTGDGPAPGWATARCDAEGSIALPATPAGAPRPITRLLVYVYTAAGRDAILRVRGSGPWSLRLDGAPIAASDGPDVRPANVVVSLRPGRDTLQVEVGRRSADDRLLVGFLASGPR